MPVVAPMPVIDPVAVADVEALLAAIPPDCELDEPGEDLRETAAELPSVDFSLQSVRSRPAKVGDKLVTQYFGTGTRGFAAADDPGLAVCVMPGRELAFAGEVACQPTGLLGWKTQTINHQTAIFRQVNKDKSAAHHDALEFPDGRTVLLTLLCEGQAATVLQLPARPMTAAEADAQKRVTYVG
jgi:hypothetical protein